MKLNCGPTEAEREQNYLADLKETAEWYRQWRKKFLWFPQRMSAEDGWRQHHVLGYIRKYKELPDCRWLETVEICNPLSYMYYSEWYFKHKLNVGEPVYRPINSSEIHMT